MVIKVKGKGTRLQGEGCASCRNFHPAVAGPDEREMVSLSFQEENELVIKDDAFREKLRPGQPVSNPDGGADVFNCQSVNPAGGQPPERAGPLESESRAAVDHVIFTPVLFPFFGSQARDLKN